jgi:hypothetical protein
VKDADGKVQYVRMMDFGSRAVRDAFSAASSRPCSNTRPMRSMVAHYE